jgi:hypothetical protein
LASAKNKTLTVRIISCAVIDYGGLLICYHAQLFDIQYIIIVGQSYEKKIEPAKSQLKVLGTQSTSCDRIFITILLQAI